VLVDPQANHPLLLVQQALGATKRRLKSPDEDLKRDQRQKQSEARRAGLNVRARMRDGVPDDQGQAACESQIASAETQ
jgi:hypothetical protein